MQPPVLRWIRVYYIELQIIYMRGALSVMDAMPSVERCAASCPAVDYGFMNSILSSLVPCPVWCGVQPPLLWQCFGNLLDSVDACTEKMQGTSGQEQGRTCTLKHS